MRSMLHTVMTSFARSTPTVVIFIMTSPLLSRLCVVTQSWHFDADGAIVPLRGKSPLYSINRDALPRAPYVKR
jgi:hypothetical protein